MLYYSNLLFLHFLFLSLIRYPLMLLFFFFNDTATTEIYTLSLHDALPIFVSISGTVTRTSEVRPELALGTFVCEACNTDRKSTRLNSSHLVISYAVFCLKKKKRRCTAHSTASSPRYCDRRYSRAIMSSGLR